MCLKEIFETVFGFIFIIYNYEIHFKKKMRFMIVDCSEIVMFSDVVECIL